MESAWINTQRVRRWREEVLGAVGACMLCGDRAGRRLSLCEPCEADLPRPTELCLWCGTRRLQSAVGLGPCGRCGPQVRVVNQVEAAFRYTHPVSLLVQRLKFRGELAAARVLGELCAEGLETAYSEYPLLIIPLPIHNARLKQRGFNQALEIARPIAKAFAVPLDRGQVTRTRPTQPQSDLVGFAARLNNVRDAFAVSGPLPDYVAIVDDVLTSGATAFALARCLRRHGAKRIDLWVAARVAI